MYANHALYLYASGSVPIQNKFELNLLPCSRDGPATANEPNSVELPAMLECSVSTSERCYEEANITERSYSRTTVFPGICDCRFPNCAWSIQMLMS